MSLRDIIVGRDDEDKEKYGKKGTIMFGKHWVGEGKKANLTNPIRLDVSRPHVMLICGKRGQGKCLHPDQSIRLVDGKKYNVREIYDTYANEGTYVLDKEDEKLIAVDDIVEVLSLEENEITSREISHLYAKRVEAEKLYRMVTSEGNEVTVTGEHPLMVSDGVWKKSEEIVEGETVACLGSDEDDVRWSEIVTIETLDYSGWVYDFTIPVSHNFFGGKEADVLCHNSYTGAVIAEEFCELEEEVRQNLCMVMIDTMGIWWSLKNANEKQLGLLNQWGFEPKTFDADVFVPEGFVDEYKESDIPFDGHFSVKPSDLNTEDWALAFDISLVDHLGILLERCIKKLRETDKNYVIDDIIEVIRNDERASKKNKEALINRFMSAKEWGVFSPRGLDVTDILSPGKISVLDFSHFGHLSGGWSVRSLILGLLSRKIYRARVKARRAEEVSTIRGSKDMDIPLTWIVMDEAHQFLPADGRTPATDALVSLVKEGRQPGISTIFITQRPGAIHPNAISQSDIIVSHRLTARPDLEALRNIMQTYMTFDIKDYINNLPRKKGSAIILDDNSERIYAMRVRPRKSWHAGDTPSALEG